ncbi:hypothetical protein QUF80_11190 [Desulfococcaceae bacterium HSG8]|nr:hypothetical protein [Desulfococcaceae bacterium HSG8]
MMPKSYNLLRFIIIFTAALAFSSPSALSAEPDFNRNCTVDLADAVICLKIAAGMGAGFRPDWETAGVDVNGDKKIGMEEAIHILRIIGNIVPASEDNDAPEQAGVIVVNDHCPQHHDFHDDGDADWVKFYAEKDKPFTIEVRNPGSQCNASIALYDSSIALHNSDDKPLISVSGNGYQTDHILLWGNSDDSEDRSEGSEGYFYAKITNADASVFGENTGYDLFLRTYEDNDSYEQANLIGLENYQHHNFHDAEDEDWVMFYAVKDEDYTVEVKNPGTRCDVWLEIYDDTDGETSVEYSSSGLLGWKADKDGMYYVRIANSVSEGFGEDTGYDLHVTYSTAPEYFAGIIGYVFDVSAGSLGNIPELTITCSSVSNVYYYESHGLYYISGLEEGNYTITASAPGYRTTDITLWVGTSTVRRDIYMWRDE